MKKILSKIYTPLIYLFFVLYILIIRLEANENVIQYSILLIISALIIAIIPFLINHHKLMIVRKWYLISVILMSLFVIMMGIDYLLVKYLNDSKIWYYAKLALQGLFLTSSIITLTYSIKIPYKNHFRFQLFDFDSFELINNLIAYILIIYSLFDFCAPELILKINSVNFQKEELTFNFVNNQKFIILIVIISIIYLSIYFALEIIKAKIKEKQIRM